MAEVKKIKIIIVTPGSTGKVEILPRDDGRWAVMEFEYGEDSKRTNTSKEIVDNNGLMKLLQQDERFVKAFGGLMDSQVSM